MSSFFQSREMILSAIKAYALGMRDIPGESAEFDLKEIAQANKMVHIRGGAGTLILNKCKDFLKEKGKREELLEDPLVLITIRLALDYQDIKKIHNSVRANPREDLVLIAQKFQGSFSIEPEKINNLIEQLGITDKEQKEFIADAFRNYSLSNQEAPRSAFRPTTST